MKKVLRALKKLDHDIRADCGSRLSYRSKYQGGKETEQRLLLMLIKNIGVQSMAAIRLMRFARDAGLPYGGEVVSRLIRYVYGMEVHWNAEIDPGVSIVHGVGLVVSHAARVKGGCILSQNVTLGEARDLGTKEMGAPTLEANVHVGPGATLLGPITIGENSKVMAGSVVTESVPPFTVVRAPEPRFISRTGETDVGRSEAVRA